MKKKRIKLIYTGGTIGGDVRGEYVERVIDRRLRPKVFLKLVDRVLDLEQIPSLELIKPSTPVNDFSEEFGPREWALIAQEVHRSVVKEGADGVVVAHGTDTMSFTAAALSYMLPGLKVPVILTGANRPLSDPASDAAQNLIDSLFVATQEPLKGVFVVFSGVPGVGSDIHLGTRVRKTRHTGGNSFESVHASPLGSVWMKWRLFRKKRDIKFRNYEMLNLIRAKNEAGEFLLRNDVKDNAALFHVVPGVNTRIIMESIQRSDVWGVILNLYNAGTGPTKGKHSLVEVAEHAARRKPPIPVFAASQHQGPVDMRGYESAESLRSAGIVPLYDLTLEAAWPKLLWVLGQIKRVDRDKVVRLMLKNVAGEISDGFQEPDS